MLQRLKILSNPHVGYFVFVSPHVDPPWGGMHGRITRIVKSKILVEFPEGVSEEFPQMVLYQLEES